MQLRCARESVSTLEVCTATDSIRSSTANSLGITPLDAVDGPDCGGLIGSKAIRTYSRSLRMVVASCR